MINIQQKITDIFPMEELAEAHRIEAELTRSYGNHTLAFFGLAPENLHFLTPDGTGLVNYRLVNNVAVVLGDPVCAPEACERVTRSFLDFCALQRWRAAFYQANSEHLSAYRTLKLRAFKMGEEAIIHPQTFTLSGSTMANVRISARRAERDEVVIHWHEGVPTVEVLQQLEHISSAWLEHKAGQHVSETGFSTGRLDELMDIAERADRVTSISPLSHGSQRAAPRVVTAVATTRAGKACAFVTFTPIYGVLTSEATATCDRSEVSDWGWSLDLMRRAPDAPPGVIELLLVRAIERFRSCGAHTVSLGLVAMADTRQELAPVQRRLVNFVIDRWHLLGDRRTLFNFKQKFHPHWESRYLLTNTTLALPKIALAVLRLRNYQGRRLARRIRTQAADTHRVHTWRGTSWQFLRYCLVGGANTIIDVLMLNILLWRFPTNNVQVLVLYNSIAYAGGALSSFFFNKYWTFRYKQRSTWKVVVRFAISLLLEVLYSNALVWLAGKALQPVIANPALWANVSKLVAVVCGMATSYALMRFWTFAGGSPPTLPASSLTELTHHSSEKEREGE
jgi:phosphatidylglycerol lysyltransferase